jgi:hypothetical protein
LPEAHGSHPDHGLHPVPLGKTSDDVEGYVRGEQVDGRELVYQLDAMEEHEDVVVEEVVDAIRKECPDYEPCAYLNGTMDPDTMKWLLAVRTGNAEEMLQYHNARFVELAQVVHHLVHGTYMAYSDPH